MLHSEKGVWAEGRPVLGIYAQGDSRSFPTFPLASFGGSTRRPKLNSQKQIPGGKGNRLPSSSRKGQRLRWQGRPGKNGDSPPRGSASQGAEAVQYSDRLSSRLGMAKACS